MTVCQRFNINFTEYRILVFVCISVSCDLWTSMNLDPYLGINAHYSQGFMAHEKNLCTKLLPYPHTIENIGQSVKMELTNYGIFEKVRFMITDNASNMIGAVKALHLKSIPCAVHTIQTIVTHFVKHAKPLLERARKLVSFFRDSPKRKQQLKRVQKSFWQKRLEFSRLQNKMERLLKLLPAIDTLRNSLTSSPEWISKKFGRTAFGAVGHQKNLQCYTCIIIFFLRQNYHVGDSQYIPSFIIYLKQ
eukprot:TRINITY_DN8993_c0_g1_i1.p1 TRINITY_DN8993_c0_g1~~TRINITY_DN8993_c0_g1_i1.p1  ORF type:complete len:279 (-),score=-6.55 TRINITY_DN8993_c0_g1_i1:31-771(-)